MHDAEQLVRVGLPVVQLTELGDVQADTVVVLSREAARDIHVSLGEQDRLPVERLHRHHLPRRQAVPAVEGQSTAHDGASGRGGPARRRPRAGGDQRGSLRADLLGDSCALLGVELASRRAENRQNPLEQIPGVDVIEWLVPGRADRVLDHVRVVGGTESPPGR